MRPRSGAGRGTPEPGRAGAALVRWAGVGTLGRTPAGDAALSSFHKYPTLAGLYAETLFRSRGPRPPFVLACGSCPGGTRRSRCRKTEYVRAE